MDSPRLPAPPIPAPPDQPGGTGVVAAFSSLASAVLWWLTLLAAYLIDRARDNGHESDPSELISTLLFFLPIVAIIMGIVAIKRLGSQQIAWIAASIGLFLGGVGPVALALYAWNQGL